MGGGDTMEVDGGPDERKATEHGDDASSKGRRSKGDAERQILLHPLAIISISDHYTRVSVGGSHLPASSRIFGLLFGVQEGLDVSIYDAVEVGYDDDKGRIVVNAVAVEKQKELLTAVYPTYELLGWYSVGSEATEADVDVQKQMTRHNESPIFLLLNPRPAAAAAAAAAVVGGTAATGTTAAGTLAGAGAARARVTGTAAGDAAGGGAAAGGTTGGAAAGAVVSAPKELPVLVHESEVHVVGDVPTTIFVPMGFALETAQPEQISVEHVVKATPAIAASQIDLHATATGTSLRALGARLRVLSAFLAAVRSGAAPPDHRLLRQISGLVGQLPAMEAGGTAAAELASEHADALAVTYLAAMQKGAALLGDVVEKFGVTHADRHRRAI